MLRLRQQSAAEVCWRCQWRLNSQRRSFHQRTVRNDGIAQKIPRRTLATATTPVRLQPTVYAIDRNNSIQRSDIELASKKSVLGFDSALIGSTTPQIPVREHLLAWQKEFGGPDDEILNAFERHPAHRHNDIRNNLAKLNYGAKADEELGENEEETFEDEDEELVTMDLFLEPGDVVELSQAGRESVLAVFVQQLGNISQFFSINGRWSHSRLTRISFAVPGCVDPALIQPLVPFMPTKPGEVALNDTNQVPRHLAAPVQDLLRRLTIESEQVYRMNAPVLDKAYSTLADPIRTRMMSLSQIAKVLLSRGDPDWTPSPSALLAVRKALNQNEFRFRSDARTQRMNNVYSIRPRNDVELVETVQEWIREYKEHKAVLATTPIDQAPKHTDGSSNIAKFIKKARQLIKLSRKYREPSLGFVGPSKARNPPTENNSSIEIAYGESFTEADQKIIDFLQAWVLTAQFQKMPNLHSSCTSILHSVGMYKGENIIKATEEKEALGMSIGHLFLQEIGVIMPYENRTIYDEQLMLPTTRLSRNVESLTKRAEETRTNPDFRDSMANLRRDWGPTTVWCIDSADAHEIDDGISVERVHGKDSEFWVHVHIANPTAFFDKTHVLSGLAAHMTATLYTPERSYPMLPTWASQSHFSLKANRPAITFSTHIDGAGNILDSKIQHGIIRNVKAITYNELSAYLGEESEDNSTRLVVGGNIPAVEHRTPPQLSPEELEELKVLYSAAKVARQGRKAAGGIFSYQNQGDLGVRLFENSQQAGLTWRSPSRERSRLVHGDPIIELTVSRDGHDSDRVSSHQIVAEMMMLACSSAASWCAERNIPVMFRGTIETPTLGMSLDEFRKKIVYPQLEKQGYLSPGVNLRYQQVLGRGIAHSAPIPHKIIGTKAYVKVTSPLRRFSDMMAHWQIEAAIRHEARTGEKINKALLAGSQGTILPFSQRQVQESTMTLSPRERIIKATSRGSDSFWAAQAFMRAFYYNEATLPETFKCLIREVSTRRRHMGILSEYAMKVVMDDPGIPCNVGDEWEVKLGRIDLFTKTVIVTPIRLLQSDSALLEQ